MLASPRTTNILLVLVLAMGTAIVAMLATGVRGGPLDPPGAPASTMQGLDDLAPSWSQRLVSTDGAADGCDSSRFACVMGGVAVLDRETGLVWQRDPFDGTSNWIGPVQSCMGTQTGGRYGWRLPSYTELMTLFDPATYNLTAGSPFIGITGQYWTSNTSVISPDRAYFLEAGKTWNIDADLKVTPAVPKQFWCVRGGGANDWS